MKWKDITESSKLSILSITAGIFTTGLTLTVTSVHDCHTSRENIRQEKKELLDSALAECDEYRIYTIKALNNAKEQVPYGLLPRLVRRVAFDPELEKKVTPFIDRAIVFDGYITANPSMDTRNVDSIYKYLKIDSLTRMAIEFITEKYREVSER